MSSPAVSKQRRLERISKGLCGNHPAEPLLFGLKMCAKCRANLESGRRVRIEKGLCGRCGQHPLKTATACQLCLWKLTETHLKQRFGLTLEDYARMEYAQERVCKICRRPCPSEQALAVDHCHRTGRVRGLLCIECNRFVGYLEAGDRLPAFTTYLTVVSEPCTTGT